MKPYKGRIYGDNHLPFPAGQPSFDAAQDTGGPPSCKHMLLAHAKLFIHQHSPMSPLHSYFPCVHISNLYTHLGLHQLRCGTLYLHLLSLIRLVWAQFSNLIQVHIYVYIWYKRRKILKSEEYRDHSE